MKKMKSGLMMGLILSMMGSQAWAEADAGATKEQAIAMVQKAGKELKSHKEATLMAINDKENKEFHLKDLYITVYSMDAGVIAHGSNMKMVGKNLMELKDVDGKAFVKERVELGKTKNSFWQSYKFLNPVNKAIEDKETYCEKDKDLQWLICGGVYADKK